jgi:hypothetical protein
MEVEFTTFTSNKGMFISLSLALRAHFNVKCSVPSARYSQALQGLFDPLAGWPSLNYCRDQMSRWPVSPSVIDMSLAES